MNYQEFLRTKQLKIINSGFDVDRDTLSDKLFEFQKDIVQWALKKGKSCVFSDCGTGKTIMQLEWAENVYKNTGGNVLIVAPLNVVQQTSRIEAEKFGYAVNPCRTQSDVMDGINITNYEMLDHFVAGEFTGVVLDESSILKSFTGKLRQQITEMFECVPYKLACTATPSPNDFMELGTHAEFVGSMTRNEMLSMYFVHDGGNTSSWRLKGHAEKEFWKWVATWAVCVRNPGDLGYDSSDYVLPELNLQEIVLETPLKDFELIQAVAETLQERREARKGSLESRCKKAANMVNGSNEQWVVWCDYNDESSELSKTIIGGVEVKGSDSPEHKENSAIEFAKGNIKAIISKPAIYGFGSNWQNCHNMIFCGLSDSYEKFYQAIRRCWRYGQENTVNVYIIISDREINILDNIKRKQAQQDKMVDSMVENMRDMTMEQIRHTTMNRTEYKPEKEFALPKF